MKILMAAPFDVKGRYQGGISSVVNTVLQQTECLSENDLEIIPYETCRIERSQKGSARFNISNIRNFVAIYTSLVKKVKKHSPEMVYYHTSVKMALLKDLLAIRHAKKKTGVKVILHIHFAEYRKIMIGKREIDKIILHILKKYIDRIVFLSKKTAEEFVAHGISNDKIEVIYNFSTIAYTEEEQQAAFQKENKDVQFLFVGSIDKRKGICDLLDCFSKIDGGYHFHICGGYTDTDVEKEAKALIASLAECVTEHGYVSGDKKKQIFMDADVLVLPSYGEGLPMVIMEAYHAGCAVITTAVGAIPEIVGEKNGFVIQPGDKEKLLDCIKKVIADRGLVKTMQKTNRLEAEKYTAKKFIQDMAKACKTVN